MLQSRWARGLASATVLSLVGLLALAGPSEARQRHADIQIVGIENVDAGTGTFTARGGILCREGTTAVEGGTTVIEQGDSLIFKLRKVFTCIDGSGSFTMRMRAMTTPCEPTDHGFWRIVSGTGRYTKLTGHGQLVGTYVPGPCDAVQGIVDVIYGSVRIH